MTTESRTQTLERILNVIRNAKIHDLPTIAAHVKAQPIQEGFSAILGAWNTRIAELEADDHGVTKHLDTLRTKIKESPEQFLGRFQKNPHHP